MRRPPRRRRPPTGPPRPATGGCSSAVRSLWRSGSNAYRATQDCLTPRNANHRGHREKKPQRTRRIQRKRNLSAAGMQPKRDGGSGPTGNPLPRRHENLCRRRGFEGLVVRRKQTTEGTEDKETKPRRTRKARRGLTAKSTEGAERREKEDMVEWEVRLTRLPEPRSGAWSGSELRRLYGLR